MPPKPPPQEPGIDPPEQPEIPALRDHGVPSIQGVDVPRIRERARPESSGIGWAAGLSAALLALGIAIWVAWPVLEQRFEDRSPASSAASPSPPAAPLPNMPGSYDEAKPGFREYHVWMSLGDAADFSPHASEVIAEVSKTSQAVPGLQIVIRIPKQFELDAPKMPSDAFKCGDPNFAVWHQAVTQLTDALARKGTKIEQVRSPRFEHCDQTAPVNTPGAEQRAYRIVIRLESPSLP